MQKPSTRPSQNWNTCFRGSEYIFFEILALRAWNSPARQLNRLCLCLPNRLGSLASGFNALNFIQNIFWTPEACNLILQISCWCILKFYLKSSRRIVELSLQWLILNFFVECDELNGENYGPCASGFGICCLFSYDCGGVVSQNGSYIK